MNLLSICGNIYLFPVRERSFKQNATLKDRGSEQLFTALDVTFP